MIRRRVDNVVLLRRTPRMETKWIQYLAVVIFSSVPSDNFSDNTHQKNPESSMNS